MADTTPPPADSSFASEAEGSHPSSTPGAATANHPEPSPSPPRPLRGFAAMKARGEDIRSLAKKGGRAHRFTSEEARAAGARGGTKTQEKRRAAQDAAAKGGEAP